MPQLLVEFAVVGITAYVLVGLLGAPPYTCTRLMIAELVHFCTESGYVLTRYQRHVQGAAGGAFVLDASSRSTAPGARPAPSGSPRDPRPPASREDLRVMSTPVSSITAPTSVSNDGTSPKTSRARRPEPSGSSSSVVATTVGSRCLAA